MPNKSDTVGSNTKKAKDNFRLVLSALLGIPVLLMCSCAIKPVKHYALATPGAPPPAEAAVFRATEKPAMKPYVKIDGQCFSVGSEFKELVVDGVLHPFAEPQMRSLEVRLTPGPHKVDIAIAYTGIWSLPFSQGRSISFEAVAGKSYELKFVVNKFNDQHAEGHIDWGTSIVEVDTGKEFTIDPTSPGQL
jgi:hypothetical protein